ncbi:DUF3147 family protein [Nonomuraea jiangxiensis]|uniref:DUF3147 family protein n=1 Tax=Nonomuraea jiangxiensis TaxID=633440 RepID=A0A1G8QFL9_9ACTN|nr:DUF3147 family protein [Nonomuraea jiangxiensis]SDJ03589.1 Protein of unknown function [Nonomuraea jiangxiensis]
MSQVWLLAGRGLLGGVLVMVFAVIGEMTTPKRFAGIFAAAPAVAIAGMTITALHAGSHALEASAFGMMAGAAGMVVYCASAVLLVRRLGAFLGSLTALVAWAAVAGTIWAMIT